MFDFLRISKFTHHINIVFVAVFIGIVVTAYVYPLISILDASSVKQLQRLESFKLLIDDAHIHLLQGRRIEDDVLLKKDVTLVETFKVIIDGVHDDIDVLEAASPPQIDLQNIAQLADYIRAYESSFLTMAAIYKKLGFFKNDASGDLDKLEKSANKVLALLEKSSRTRLLSAYLSARRAERGFINQLDVQQFTEWSGKIKTFNNLMMRSGLTSTNRKLIANASLQYQEILFKISKDILKQVELAKMYNAAGSAAEPLFGLILDQVKQLIQDVRIEGKAKSAKNTQLFSSALGLTALLVVSALVWLRIRMTKSLQRLNSTVQAIDYGNYEARTRMEGGDELSNFGRILDKMLDDRLHAAQQTEQENEDLNDSVIRLLNSASRLSENDLTVSLKVGEDVTGPVADAINQMVTETVNVLKNIKELADKVRNAANTVSRQGQKVVQLADIERSLMTQTIAKLKLATQAMSKVSQLVHNCESLAAHAKENTNTAMETVMNNVKRMSEIRETISETEKRIKRLGERSQEITGIVGIINTIAERTHVLALNASMQAAAAGESGRGFAVVADEVQRLAESSRNSTAKIESLVKNIQMETAETMLTMNKTIGQVVSGADLAESASKQMLRTQKTTDDLTAAVNVIATQTNTQVELTNQLRDEALKIQMGTKKTHSEIELQTTQTNNLLVFSQSLVKSVEVFKLPAA